MDSAYFSQHSTMSSITISPQDTTTTTTTTTATFNQKKGQRGAEEEEVCSFTRRMSQPASSCWSGLEKKLFWFTENKDFFKKFRLNNIRHHRPPLPPTETGGSPASSPAPVRESNVE